jgi:DNA-binding NarL/FixJ family response regulator
VTPAPPGGLANKQIAARLHLSPRTVEKHVASLLRETGARSRTGLVAGASPAAARDPQRAFSSSATT